MKGASAPLRLFFALWPDDRQREALASVAKAASPVPLGRPVPAANLHVTIAFLGNVAPARIPSLQELAAARTWPRTVLVLDRLAWWPKAKLLCLEATALPGAFATAVETFHEDLRRAGFNVERRPFRAHVTLARNVPAAPADTLRDLPVPPYGWPVQRVVLVGSTPTPEGSIYRVLERA